MAILHARQASLSMENGRSWTVTNCTPCPFTGRLNSRRRARCHSLCAQMNRVNSCASAQVAALARPTAGQTSRRSSRWRSAAGRSGTRRRCGHCHGGWRPRPAAGSAPSATRAAGPAARDGRESVSFQGWFGANWRQTGTCGAPAPSSGASTLKLTLRNRPAQAQWGTDSSFVGLLSSRCRQRPQGVAKGWLAASCSWRFMKSAICARCLAMGEGLAFGAGRRQGGGVTPVAWLPVAAGRLRLAWLLSSSGAAALSPLRLCSRCFLFGPLSGRLRLPGGQQILVALDPVISAFVHHARMRRSSSRARGRRRGRPGARPCRQRVACFADPAGHAQRTALTLGQVVAQQAAGQLGDGAGRAADLGEEVLDDGRPV